MFKSWKISKKCDKYFIRSLSQEMYLQKMSKSSLCLFDDKRYYGSNFENKPWG